MKKYILILAAALMLPLGAMAESLSWDFTTLSSTDLTNITSDSNWSEDSSTEGRYIYGGSLSAAALTANSTELEYTAGLKFTCGTSKLRINTANKRFELNGASIVVTIPDLTAGQTLTVVCKTASSSEARGFTTTNLTSVSGYFDSTTTDEQTNVATVTADGDVTLTTTKGMNVFSITVADATSSNSGSSSTTTYNSVSYNASYNQAKIVLSTGDVLYYNTDEVSIAFDDDNSTVTVTGSSFTDEIVGLVTKVSFNVADNTTSSGTIADIEGAVVITEAKGWFESVYAEWEPLDGAASYNVYVKGGNYTSYTQIDDELIRYYDGYVRADMVGLVAGDDYALKIVPVDSDGNEVSDSANEATDMAVVNYSRDGFAHFNYSDGIGAYNDDGSLKDGARVIYVYADNADDVTCTVQTGSSSSSTTTYTGMQQIIYGYQKGYDTTPITFRIIGTITEDDIDELLSSEEGLQIKGKNSYSEMNITIEGIGEDAVIHGFGILIRNCTSIELRNFALMKFMDDGVSLDTDNSHIWVHNLDIFYGQEGSDSDQAKGDGSLDIKGDSQYITVYNNRFWDSGKCSLCGMTSETTNGYITYHHNWFDHSDSRHARIRTLSVHLFNNYYDGNSKFGVGAAMASSAFVDRNYFRAAKYPMCISYQGSEAGSIMNKEAGGMIKAYGNVFAENQSSFSYITYADNSTEFDAYEVDDPATTVPSTVVSVSGSNCYNNFDTDASLMYEYTPDDADDVPTIVTGYYGAGRLNHGDFAYNIDGDDDSSVDTDLQDAVFNYTSTLVSIQGAGTSSSSTGSTNTENTESGSSSESGSTSGGSTVDTSETIIVNFTNSEPSNTTLVSVSGNYSKSKGTATYNGTEYNVCVKMESSTTITLTTTTTYDITLVFGDEETASFKFDSGSATTGTSSTYTISSVAAGEHTITKANSVNLFLIVFTPVSE